MRIREARADDADGIARLHAESWRATYRGQYADSFLDGPVYEDRANEWRERLTSPATNQYVIVAQDGDQLAGFACVYAQDDERWGSLLDNLHVVVDRHGAGIGRLLIRETAAWAREHDASHRFYLWVLEANQRARRFYERLGATNVERRQVEHPDRGSPIALRYAWDDVDRLIAATDGAIRQRPAER